MGTASRDMVGPCRDCLFSAIVFCRVCFSGQKVEAHRLKLIFGLAEMKAGELHGNLTQAMRLEVTPGPSHAWAWILVGGGLRGKGEGVRCLTGSGVVQKRGDRFFNRYRCGSKGE